MILQYYYLPHSLVSRSSQGREEGLRARGPILTKGGRLSQHILIEYLPCAKALQGIVNQTGLPCWQKWPKTTDNSASTQGWICLTRKSRWCSHQRGWLEQSCWRKWRCGVCRGEAFKGRDSKYETDIVDKKDVFPVAARPDIWNSQRNKLRVSLRQNFLMQGEGN